MVDGSTGTRTEHLAWSTCPQISEGVTSLTLPCSNTQRAEVPPLIRPQGALLRGSRPSPTPQPMPQEAHLAQRNHSLQAHLCPWLMTQPNPSQLREAGEAICISSPCHGDWLRLSHVTPTEPIRSQATFCWALLSPSPGLASEMHRILTVQVLTVFKSVLDTIKLRPETTRTLRTPEPKLWKWMHWINNMPSFRKDRGK